jgi:hypothetical protein
MVQHGQITRKILQPAESSLSLGSVVLFTSHLYMATLRKATPKQEFINNGHVLENPVVARKRKSTNKQ